MSGFRVSIPIIAVFSKYGYSFENIIIFDNPSDLEFISKKAQQDIMNMWH